MEKRDLYDKNRNATGKIIYANEEVPEGYYLLISVIFIQNNEGKFLIQKTSKEKGGKFSSTGGHMNSGENTYQGIIREVMEEIGIDISPYKDKLKMFRSRTGGHYHCDLYYLKQDFDINNCILQKEEVDSVEWLSIDEINELISKGLFHKSHSIMFKECLEYLNNNI